MRGPVTSEAVECHGVGKQPRTETLNAGLFESTRDDEIFTAELVHLGHERQTLKSALIIQSGHDLLE
jgi:hypothetical protein